MCGQFLQASGALAGDDDPFLGKEILSQFRRGNPPLFLSGGDALW